MQSSLWGGLEDSPVEVTLEDSMGLLSEKVLAVKTGNLLESFEVILQYY